MGVSDYLQQECHSAMLHDNMNYSRHMMHDQHVEEAGTKKKCRYSQMARSFDVGFFKQQLEIQDKPRFKKQVSNKAPTMFPRPSGYKVSNLKPMKGKDNSSLTRNPTCGKCGKKDYGDCLKETDNCFCCAKSGHKVMTIPNIRGEDKGSGQA